jgi:hypothetical protein
MVTSVGYAVFCLVLTVFSLMSTWPCGGEYLPLSRENLVGASPHFIGEEFIMPITPVQDPYYHDVEVQTVLPICFTLYPLLLYLPTLLSRPNKRWWFVAGQSVLVLIHSAWSVLVIVIWNID